MLVPLESVADKSNTPAYKSIVVSVVVSVDPRRQAVVDEGEPAEVPKIARMLGLTASLDAAE